MRSDLPQGGPPFALHEIRVEIPHGSADAADEALLELGEAGWSLVEDAIGRRAWIVGVFGGEAEARARWTELRPRLSVGPLPQPAIRGLAETEWRDSYKAHFHAWTFGRLHWVPVWERESFRAPAGHEVLWLDPGLAFGTGNHETTRLCIEGLVAIEAGLRDRNARPEGLGVIDAGCGSGILALSAALLGFGHVEGFDNDPEAVRVSVENASLNRLDGRVHFRAADVATGLEGREADVVLANIQSDVLVRHAAGLIRAVRPGGTLILSGILAAELSGVSEAFVAVAPGWARGSRIDGEWAALDLRRSRQPESFSSK